MGDTETAEVGIVDFSNDRDSDGDLPGMNLSLRMRTASATVVICVAAVSWAAPAASADVASLDIVSLGPGAGYGTGCTYLLIAKTKDTRSTPSEMPVSFNDLNRASRIFPQNEFYARHQIYVTPVVADHAFALWTPTGRGKHTLMAFQTSAGGPTRTVTVTSGTAVGPGCIVGR